MPSQKSTQNLPFDIPKMLFIYFSISYIIFTLHLGSVNGCAWSFTKPLGDQIPEKIQSFPSLVSESVIHIDDSNWNQVFQIP